MLCDLHRLLIAFNSYNKLPVILICKEGKLRLREILELPTQLSRREGILTEVWPALGLVLLFVIFKVENSRREGERGMLLNAYRRFKVIFSSLSNCVKTQCPLLLVEKSV